jgi:hypothetical protein
VIEYRAAKVEALAAFFAKSEILPNSFEARSPLLREFKIRA